MTIIDQAKEISDRNALAILQYMYPHGKLHGNEFKIGNAAGDSGDSLSLNISTGIGKDFAVDKAYDVLGLWAEKHGLKMSEAAKQIIDYYGSGTTSCSEKPNNSKAGKSKATVVSPAPDNAPPPPTHRWIAEARREMTSRWEYRNTDGELVGYRVRFDWVDEKGTKKKAVPPLSYTTSGWMWAEGEQPLPLYGAERIASSGDTLVVVVEGEKTADAARNIFQKDNFLVVTWQGGSSAANKTDWRPLQGRNVLIIPDADKPGAEAAKKVKAALHAVGAATVVIAHLPPGLPEGWDLADEPPEGMSLQQIIDCIFEEPQQDVAADEEPRSSEGKKKEPVSDFRIAALGYDRNKYYFLDLGEQVQSFSATGLSAPANLMQLASLSVYDAKYQGGKGQGIEAWRAQLIANDLMMQCRARGVFDAEKIRGSGAWFDAGRTVFHAGSYLVVSGDNGFYQVAFRDFQTDYYYERGKPIAHTMEMPDKGIPESFRVLCESLSWDNKLAGTLFAGWCILAPLCGLLPWRPHIWITSPPGAGKTWIMNNIMIPILGPLLLSVLGATTEAGLRQALLADARPIAFDEAEGETSQSIQTMQTVLQYVRQSSSDTGGKIIKGTIHGNAIQYKANSMFAFLSISVALHQRADLDRVTVLQLRTNTADEKLNFHKKVQPLIKRVLTPENCARLRMYALANAQRIRDNTKIFSDVVANHLGSQRHGDQLGALLAGASILRNIPPDNDKIKKYVEGLPWEEFTSSRQETDELALVAYLQQRIIRMKNSADRDSDYNISQLVAIASGMSSDFPGDGVLQNLARIRLAQFGIAAPVTVRGSDRKYVAISNNHSQIAELLEGTPWQKSYRITLKRVHGALAEERTASYPGGGTARSTLIPIEVML